MKPPRRLTEWGEIRASGVFDDTLRGSGSNGPVVYAYGLERKNDVVRITFLGRSTKCRSTSGVWIFVAERQDNEPLLKFVDQRPISKLPKRLPNPV